MSLALFCSDDSREKPPLLSNTKSACLSPPTLLTSTGEVDQDGPAAVSSL